MKRIGIILCFILVVLPAFGQVPITSNLGVEMLKNNGVTLYLTPIQQMEGKYNDEGELIWSSAFLPDSESIVFDPKSKQVRITLKEGGGARWIIESLLPTPNPMNIAQYLCHGKTEEDKMIISVSVFASDKYEVHFDLGGLIVGYICK